MELILLAIITAAALSVVMLKFGNDGYTGWHVFLFLCGVFSAAASAAALIVFSFAARDWIAAEHRAEIINREYGTSYTREEVFYASDVIETVRQLDRKRVEINGDILKNK